MKCLTEKQLKLIEFIRDYQKQEKKAPSYQLMSDFMGITNAGVMAHLYAMERKGFIKRRNMFLIK